jgi:DNA-binding CsgD family transcriptional regulator
MQLTRQELQIAHMAAQGQSNRQIGQQLYISPRTVGSHLYHIFPKLGVTTRAQLAAALENTPAHVHRTQIENEAMNETPSADTPGDPGRRRLNGSLEAATADSVRTLAFANGTTRTSRHQSRIALPI